MSMEPETDNRREPGPTTPREWAAWALLGDVTARVPVTLVSLHARVAQAICQAVEADRANQKEKHATLAASAYSPWGIEIADAIRNPP